MKTLSVIMALLFVTTLGGCSSMSNIFKNAAVCPDGQVTCDNPTVPSAPVIERSVEQPKVTLPEAEPQKAATPKKPERKCGCSKKRKSKS